MYHYILLCIYHYLRPGVHQKLRLHFDYQHLLNLASPQLHQYQNSNLYHYILLLNLRENHQFHLQLIQRFPLPLMCLMFFLWAQNPQLTKIYHYNVLQLQDDLDLIYLQHILQHLHFLPKQIQLLLQQLMLHQQPKLNHYILLYTLLRAHNHQQLKQHFEFQPQKDSFQMLSNHQQQTNQFHHILLYNLLLMVYIPQKLKPHLVMTLLLKPNLAWQH